ncbi:GUN4 domain-containing protein [Nostoc sp.]|uniref:GUN4 domain-containing protein n=1 Tax=Nostoc sp. TaxID=1180 RepID=UPI002FFC7BD0
MQKRIWESVGKDYEKFGDRVGWRNESWLPYSDLKLTSNSPQGHLPVTHQVVGSGGLFSVWVMFRVYIWGRRVECLLSRGDL